MDYTKVPILDEFKAEIERLFQEHWHIPAEEMHSLLYADKNIEHQYQEALERYERGEISLGVLTQGIPATIAYEYIMDY